MNGLSILSATGLRSIPPSVRRRRGLRGLLVLLVVVVVPSAAPEPASAREHGEVDPGAPWKDSIQFPEDPFVVDPRPNPRWVKFTILTADPARVYFQNSREIPFHYDFAVLHLAPFRGASREEFDAATLFEAGRKAVLGAVILPPAEHPNPADFGIQLAGRDAFPPETVVELFRAVRARVIHDRAQAYYFPTFEQKAAAERDAEFLAANGVVLGSPDLWAQGNGIYANGWALGTLKFFRAADIRPAYEAGALRPSDVLLTDGIPAELPFVRGILSLAPATPNSHVALLARSFGVPFAYLALQDDVARARALVGREVVVSAFDSFARSDFRLFDIDGLLSRDAVAEILALKSLPPLEIPPMRRAETYSLAVKELGPADVDVVGGKAANYGLLLRSIPENSRIAAAFTFDLWMDFLSQPLASGRTLRQEIDARLAPHRAYPPADMGSLVSALEGVRDLFEKPRQTVFRPDLADAVISALSDPAYGFDPARNLRFRSSTNFEDTEQFVGAGLFESRSGCLLDDLDDDEDGPSRCDAAEMSERGVFRALRRVFASLYNDNAYLERLRWGVDESEVGMAVLVHHSFPDESELANGVATLTRDGPNFSVEMVSQVGATSVANPEDGSLPERVRVLVFESGSSWVELVEGSNLLPLGATVLESPGDYERFARLFAAVARSFPPPGPDGGALDFEYKKIAPGDQLIVKQVRRIPEPDSQRRITPFFLGLPATLATFQGEAGDIFANHRLKSTWTIETESLWLTEDNVRRGIFSRLAVDYTDNCGVYRFEGDVSALPGGGQDFGDGETARLRWRFDDLPNPRLYELSAGPLPFLVAASESPFVTLSDVGLRVRVAHALPVLGWDGLSQAPELTQEETIALAVEFPPRAGDLEQERSAHAGGVSVRTRFFWPPPPGGIVAGYTAPLVRWIETVIEGLTTEPLVLVGSRSQTYRPEHHNFSEHFLFAPHEEEGIAPETLAELDARNVRWIHVTTGDVSGLELYGACELLLDCACERAHPVLRRGDCNDDGRINIADVVCVLNWLFAGTGKPGCEAATNANGDAGSDIADATYLLLHLFLDGPPPSPPYPECGPGTLPGDRESCRTPPASCRQ